MAHRYHPIRPHAGTLRPGIPMVAFVLPFAILAGTAFALRPAADGRAWFVLAVGLVVLLVLAAVGPVQGYRATARYGAARRVVLRALLATMTLFSLCCAWLAAVGLDGALGIWPGIIFVPGWMIFALLIPLWVDSPAVRTEEPITGWKSIGGFKLLYSDPNDDALWVHIESQWVDYLSALYSPNLGHRWGRAEMTTLVVLIVAMLAMLIAA